MLDLLFVEWAAVCGCGTPWAFLLPFFAVSAIFRTSIFNRRGISDLVKRCCSGLQ